MGEGGQVLDIGGRISGMRGNCGRPPLPTKFIEQISFQEIEEREFLGKGSFGVVIRGFWRGQDVAVKIFHKDSEQEAFKVELRQLSRVDHPNIIRLYAASTSHYVFLVMEYAECGSLYKVLHEKKGEHQVYYHSGHAISWVLQCALGVEYLHNMRPKPIIHRDLKSPNLLLVNEGLGLKICDFGTACDQHTVMTNNKGSAAWMAPEVFEGTEYSEKCDIFSFGIILWEIFTRRLPFQDNGNDLQILWAIHNGKRPPPIQDFPTVLENLMERCWAANIQIRPNMSDVVEQIREIQRFFPEASDPLVFSEGEMNAQTFAESISEVTDEEDIKSLTSDKTFQTAQDTLKSVSPNFDYSKSEVDNQIVCSEAIEGCNTNIASTNNTNNKLDGDLTPSSRLNQPTNKETKANIHLQPELTPTLQPLDFSKLNEYTTHENSNATSVSTNPNKQSSQISAATGGSQKLLHSNSQHLGTPSSAGTPKTPSPRLRSLLNMAGYSSQDIQDASMSPVTPPSQVKNQQDMLSAVKSPVSSGTPISIPSLTAPITLTSSEPTKAGFIPQKAVRLHPVQGYRTPPEELGSHHMLHPHQPSQFQGIPQLPQYDPKLLQNAPKELMRGISYPIPDDEPYLQGPRYAWMESAQSPPQAVYPPMYFPPNQSFPYYHPGSVAGRYGHYPTARPNYPLSDYIPAPYYPQTGVTSGASKLENELTHSRSHSSIKGLSNMMDRTHLDPTQQHTTGLDGDVPCGSPGSHMDPRILSPAALGLPPGVHSGSQHSPVHGMVPPNQPNASYNWRSFQNPIGQYYHDPNAVDDRWAHWGTTGAVPNQGNSPSSQGGSGSQLDPKLYDIPSSMGATATPNTASNVGEVTPNTTKWQNKMMPYDMLSGNNYPVGNMFSGYGGGSNFSRRTAGNSMYPREPRGIGPFLPRVPPAQTPIGSLMPQAHSPYNLSPHGSQGLGSVTGADYSPRAKRRDGGQQTRPISADVGRLFAVEEHSNERTGTNVSGETSSASHGQGGFKKGHRRASSYGSTPSNTVGLRVNSAYGQQQRPPRTDYTLNHGHSYTQLDPQHDGNMMGQSSYIGGPHPGLMPQEQYMYNHEGMMDPMDLLDPELRPIPPQPGCEPSMQIYQDHRKMATDYLNVRNEINEMRQRKLELEETLKMSDEDLLRSVIRNDRNHQGQLPSGAALHVQPDPAEVEQYLQLTTEKNNLVQLRDKLTTQLDLIKQTQAKSTQNHTGIPQNSIKPLDQPKSNNANKYTQEFKATSGQPKDTEFNTTKALSLSLAPSVAMTLGSGAIPPTIVTPPTNDPKSLLSQPPPTFARQISSNSDVGDSDTDWVVVKRAQTKMEDTQ